MSNRILLVENDPDHARLYGEALREAGHPVTVVGRARDALRYAHRRRPGLVVTEVRLPDMDGRELLGRMVSRYPHLPVMLHTTHAGYRESFLSWVADEYVVKTPDTTVLLEAVDRLLGRRSVYRRLTPPAPARVGTRRDRGSVLPAREARRRRTSYERADAWRRTAGRRRRRRVGAPIRAADSHWVG